MSQWDGYEAFVHVMDSGSFTAAAQRLKVSKSVVSRLVTDLEARLGAQLLFRTTRRLSPTDLGAVLYHRCLNLFEGLAEIENEAMDFSGEPRGQLRVVAYDNFGEHYIAPLAAQLSERYPLLKIEIQITSQSIDLVAEGYDLAIMFSQLTSSSLLSQKIYELPHVVAASPAYLARHGRPEIPEDLKQHNCLTATFDACIPWQFLDSDSLLDLDVKGSWRSNNGAVLLEAALRGIGIIRLPELYLRPYFRAGTLVPLLLNFASAAMPVWAVYPSGKHIPLKVRLFIDFMKKGIRELDMRTPDFP